MEALARWTCSAIEARAAGVSSAARRIRWVGLMAAGDELEQAGLDFDTAMRRIHVREADGRLVSGVPAFVVIWRRLPAYRLLAGGVERLGLTRPLEWGYARFAERRYRKRCRDGACGIGR
ncbi:thiol-disulfide oxidoreductase DCC family protein [Thiohalocapsa marina]